MTKLTYFGANEHGSHNFQTAEGAMLTAYIADGIPTPQPGQALECEVEQKTSKAGKAYTKVISINGQRGKPAGQGGGFQRGGGGRGAPAYDPKTFVSNVVGQAIAAKLITKPEELAPWAITAYKTMKSLEPATVKTEVVDTPPAATPGAVAAPPSAPLPNDDIPF